MFRTAIFRSFSVACHARQASSVTYNLEEMLTRRSRERLINEIDLQQAINNLKTACPPTTIAQPVSNKHAAVLVPIFQAPDGTIHVVLTQRSSKLSSHAGEVCLPGGKRDSDDVDDIATALREAEEECGIPRESVQVIATMPPVLSKHLLSVTAVVGVVPSNLKFTPNPAEVAAIFTVPLSMFLSSGSGYSFRDMLWDNHSYRIHAWEYQYSDKDAYTIWGLTAGLLIMVAERAFGTVPTFEVHRPGAAPYTSLAVEQGRLVFRGSAAGVEEGAPSSAAVPGAVVTDEEAAAAVGCETPR